MALALICLATVGSARADNRRNPSYTHYVAAFGGLTVVHDINHTTIGAQYERRTNFMEGKLGVGGAAELIMGGPAGSFSSAVLFYYHAGLGAKFFWGPGYEALDGVQEVLIRVGLGYDIFAGAVAVTPQVAVDIAGNDTALLAGVTLGLGL